MNHLDQAGLKKSETIVNRDLFRVIGLAALTRIVRVQETKRKIFSLQKFDSEMFLGAIRMPPMVSSNIVGVCVGFAATNLLTISWIANVMMWPAVFDVSRHARPPLQAQIAQAHIIATACVFGVILRPL